MRIPHVGGTGNTFGQRGPDRASPFNPDTRGITAGLDAMANLGEAGQAAGMQLVRVQAAEAARQQQEDQELARAQATNALLDTDVQIKAKAQDLALRQSTGDLDWRNMEPEAKDAFDAMEMPTIPGLDPADAERLRGGFERAKLEGMLSVRTLAQAGKRAEFKGQIVKLRDTLGKQASDPGADVDRIVAMGAASRSLAVSAGMGDSFDKEQQDFADRAYFDNAKARLNAVRGSLDGLAGLEQEVTGENGRFAGKLDADKQNALLSQIATYRNQLTTQAQHAQDKAEATAERALTHYEAQIATGVDAPMETKTAWADALEGGTPEQKQRFRDLLQSEGEVRAVLASPPAEQRAYLQQLEAKQQREGATVTQQAHLARLKTGVEAGIKLLHDSPLEAYATREGKAVPPLDLQALVGGNVDAVRQQVSDRMVMLRAARLRYGPDTGTSPLLANEAAAIAGALKQAAPQAQAKLFGALRQAFGDDQAYQGAMQQIAPDSPVRALAGKFYALQRNPGMATVTSASPRGQFGDVALQLLKGEALLNPTKATKAEDGKGTAFPMPPPKDVAEAIDRSVGQAFAGRPDEFQTAVQAVRAYYAAKSSDEGDVSGELDDDRLALAVRAVVGDTARIEGRDVVPPWGMDANAFEDTADTYIAARLKAAGLEDPGNVSLLNARGRDNVYLLVRGMQPLVDKHGVPLVIRIGGPR